MHAEIEMKNEKKKISSNNFLFVLCNKDSNKLNNDNNNTHDVLCFRRLIQ